MKLINIPQELNLSVVLRALLGKLTPVSRFTSVYMYKLLYALDSLKGPDVTGITFVYDGFKDSIRPFCFITFNNGKHVFSYHKKSLFLYDRYLSGEASLGVPIMLSEFNKDLLPDRKTDLTEDLSRANLLSSFILPENDPIDEQNNVQVNDGEVIEPDISEDELEVSVNYDYDLLLREN